MPALGRRLRRAALCSADHAGYVVRLAFGATSLDMLDGARLRWLAICRNESPATNRRDISFPSAHDSRCGERGRGLRQRSALRPRAGGLCIDFVEHPMAAAARSASVRRMPRFTSRRFIAQPPWRDFGYQPSWPLQRWLETASKTTGHQRLVLTLGPTREPDGLRGRPRACMTNRWQAHHRHLPKHRSKAHRS